PEYQQVFGEWVAGLGFRGVLVLFFVYVVTVLVAPVPGGPVQILAGAVYGTWGGLLIMLAGWVAGTLLIFSLVGKFGLPLVRRFLGGEALDTWSFLSNEKKTSMVVFILFLIPGLPKSFIAYMGPLTNLPIVQFTVISVFGRFPALLSSTAMGDAAMQGNWPLFFVVFAITAVTGLLGIQFRERIIRRFKEQ
ncbi:MAG: VTT domain-containing protein, partial [Treponema sp.]|nr:VTT domain-containing protein [Treponema sp.]